MRRAAAILSCWSCWKAARFARSSPTSPWRSRPCSSRPSRWPTPLSYQPAGLAPESGGAPNQFSPEVRQDARGSRPCGPRTLDVNSVLEGTYQRIGPVIRISLQLISRDTGAARWASRYDLRADDMLKFQDDLAQKVVENLSIQVSAAEHQAMSGPMTRSPEAYNLYLQARFYSNEYKMRSTLGSIRQGRQLLLQAIAMDPGFAEAHSSLSESYGMEAANFQENSKE